MGRRNLDIGSIDGIQAAIDYLSRLKKAQKTLDAVVEELINEARDVAASEYAGTDAALTSHSSKGKHTLTASGDQIVFIEFGAGMTTDGSGEFAAHAPFNVEEGSFSVANEGMYAKTGFQYWKHDGQTYNMLLPHPGMEMAREYFEDHVEDRIKEAFSDD